MTSKSQLQRNTSHNPLVTRLTFDFTRPGRGYFKNKENFGEFEVVTMVETRGKGACSSRSERVVEGDSNGGGGVVVGAAVRWL